MARANTNYIFIHCAATRPGQDVHAFEIDRWHKARGWSRIGYHRVIRLDGTAEAGRPIDMVGAHVRGLNRVSVGICLIGGCDELGEPAPLFTDAQLATLRREIDACLLLYPGAEVLGHRDAPNVRKACPSFDVRHWLRTGEVIP